MDEAARMGYGEEAKRGRRRGKAENGRLAYLPCFTFNVAYQKVAAKPRQCHHGPGCRPN